SKSWPDLSFAHRLCMVNALLRAVHHERPQEISTGCAHPCTQAWARYPQVVQRLVHCRCLFRPPTIHSLSGPAWHGWGGECRTAVLFLTVGWWGGGHPVSITDGA